MSSNQKLDQAKKQKNYSSLIGLLCSKTFRGPIKRFIDENCQSFEDKTENSHLQFQIHKQFADLVDSLLSHIKDELKISDNEFVELAKIGFERPEDRPYFEQVVVCDNYEWFKNCMVKRNITLKEQSYKLMYVNQGDLQFTKDSTINQMMIEKEKIELECALQMSLAAEEEKHKLYTGEQNIEKAIEKSKIEAASIPTSKPDKVENSTDIKETISSKDDIFDLKVKKEPTTFVKVTKVKPNKEKYTPQLITTTTQEPILNTKTKLQDKDVDLDLKNLKIQAASSNQQFDKYAKVNTAIEQKVIDLSSVRSKVDCFMEDNKKFDRQMELQNQKLDEDFFKISEQEKSDYNAYRKKLLQMKEEKLTKKVEEEHKSNVDLKNLGRKLNNAKK